MTAEDAELIQAFHRLNAVGKSAVLSFALGLSKKSSFTENSRTEKTAPTSPAERFQVIRSDISHNQQK